MSRTLIGNTTLDLQADSGGVLWSFVQGEQLELPITLDFIENIAVGYEFEAVIVEGENIPGESEKPTSAKVGGVQTKLVVRKPIYRGAWNAATSYSINDLVDYSGKQYLNPNSSGYVSAVTPDLDPNWLEHVNNTIYLQFDKTISVSPAWTVQPTAISNVYGFFELRVTETILLHYPRTWKPVRGLVELLYSPTEVVPD